MTTLPPITAHDEVTSTNDLALAAARQGAPHGACFLAESQTKGRGRREVGGERRHWHSPAGQSVYLSVVLRTDLAAPEAAVVTLTTASRLRRLLAEVSGVEVGVKWPNDLYIGGRKLAGILTEGVIVGTQLEAMVVGVGVNVNVTDVPQELEGIMTSLGLETGRAFDRLALAHGMRQAIVDAAGDVVRGGLADALEDLRAHDVVVGRLVEVTHEGRARRGRAAGIDATGGLRVEIEGTGVVVVHAGEVVFVKEE